VDPVRFAEPPRSREAPRSSEQQRGAGSSKSGSSRQREDNKREARPPSAAVKGALAEAASSVTTSVGIFERIYSVTSNCTASGIKSIFKTTAFVPAAASRRYSDVSGLSAGRRLLRQPLPAPTLSDQPSLLPPLHGQGHVRLPQLPRG